MRVLVPGIAGFVGKAIGKHLLDSGHEVLGVIRSEKDKAAVPTHPRVKLVLGDVTSPDELIRTLPDLDACIYLPGLLREYPSRGITFQQVHADGVKNMIGVAKLKGATRWIQMSALGVGKAYTGYYSTKLEGEQHVKRSGLAWTIFRPSVVFSEEYDPRLNFVSELGKVIAKAPVIPVFGNGMYRLQPIALEVLARAMVDALMMPETIGKTYEVGGPEKLTYRDILKTIASAQGMGGKPVISIPFAPVKLAATLLDNYAFFPITRDQITMLQHENIVEQNKDETAFEETFHPRRVSFENGVRSYFAGKPRA
jgi:NADH dehydrogenase